MVKASSPVRLQQALMEQASLTGKRFHRSAAEQIEYWANIGRQVTSVIDPDTLLSVATGLARIQVEPVYGKAVKPETVFQQLERDRSQGSLSTTVTDSTIKFQASRTHPGYLERISPESGVVVGQFKDSEFIPLP